MFNFLPHIDEIGPDDLGGRILCRSLMLCFTVLKRTNFGRSEIPCRFFTQ